MEKMVGEYPWLSAAMFWIAGARMLLKWVSGPIQSRLTEAMVRLAGDTEGDELVHRILKNPVYRMVGFLLFVETADARDFHRCHATQCNPLTDGRSPALLCWS